MENRTSKRPLASTREVFFYPRLPEKPPLTRRERRADRQRAFLSARDGRIAAQLARVDYKTAGESGALTPPQRSRLWHRNGRLNGHAPPPGRAWDRAGPARVVRKGDDRATDTTTA